MSDEVKRFAVIDGGNVVNVILLTDAEAAGAVLPEGQSVILAGADACPGGSYDAETGAFSRPPAS